jgi:hypothetical protein
MKIDDFGRTYHLKICTDECEEQIILGKLGHIFEYGSGRFGILLDEKAGSSQGRLLLGRRKTALQAGFQMKQEAEFESVLLFNPDDSIQAELAIRLVKAKKKRTVHSSPASLQNLLRPPTQMAPQAVGTPQSQQMTLST